MKEKEIVNQIKEYLKGLVDCFFFKEHSGQFCTAGLPDLIVCYKGKFMAFEVKPETCRLTMLQAVTLKRIERAGVQYRFEKAISQIEVLFAARYIA
jgi:hypothetical protein